MYHINVYKTNFENVETFLMEKFSKNVFGKDITKGLVNLREMGKIWNCTLKRKCRFLNIDWEKQCLGWLNSMLIKLTVPLLMASVKWQFYTNI